MPTNGILDRLPTESVPPLADPGGITTTVSVSTVSELNAAFRNLESNTRLVIAAGEYNLTQILPVLGGVRNVVIRGATGNRDDVVIRGAGMNNSRIWHGFCFEDATDVVIANLSVGEVYYHPIQLQPHKGTDRVTIYNVRLFDGGEQLLRL